MTKPKFFYTLNEVAISTIVGINDYERKNPQELIFSVSAELSQIQEESSMIEIIKDYCRKHKPLLLERMAYELALFVLDQIPSMARIELTIKKPTALKQARCAYVTIDMSRS